MEAAREMVGPTEPATAPTPDPVPVAPRTTALKPFMLLALAASFFYFGWWFREDRLHDPWLLAGFVFAALYVALQVFAAWFVYLRMKRAPEVKAPAGLKVDVFIPVYDEKDALVESGLRAATDLSYPHRTFLLDDSENSRHRELARSLGAEYVTREGRKDAKAGNVNAALNEATGDFITIFDVDHIPRRAYLNDVLGHFQDPRVGFVQSGVGFRNQTENWVTRAMAEQAADAYGPASGGMHGCDAAPVWGSHCTFRRLALESIGGHSSGLAEDLHTSIRLHAAGWRSVFVPAVKARGLVPEDLKSCYKQQFKWARGVFEILLTVYPALCWRLSVTQNVAYLLRCSYYLIGPVFLVHSLVAALVLSVATESARAAFSEYLVAGLPFGGLVVGIRRLALSAWHGKSGQLKASWRGYLLSFLLWPVYTLGLVLTFMRARVEHIATPKVADEKPHALLVVPQVLLIGALLGSVAYRFQAGILSADVLPVVFALTTATVHALAVCLAVASVQLRRYRDWIREGVGR